MKPKTWNLAERLAEDVFEHLLLGRGLESPDQQQAFFNPSLADLSSPSIFQNMDVAIDRIVQAIEAKQPMVVWGDFDADGVTSTAILWETLHQLGADVMPYIPSRDAEGHGFSEVGMQKLIDDGVKLVVTVDHGITALDEVDILQKSGVDVIITDHHEPIRAKGSEVHGSSLKVDGVGIETNELRTKNQEPHIYDLPPAVAVVHPLLMEKPQPLAGCGVSYMLSYAVWLCQSQGGKRARVQEASQSVAEDIKELDTPDARAQFAKSAIELAGIGTIADMVPLLEDNRVLAAFGLPALLETKRPGLRRLFQLAGIVDKKKLGTYDVGFGVGPRLNAPGRLGDALESLRLLCAKNEGRAGQLARELDDLNKHRQDLLVQVTQEAKAEVLKHEDGVFVLAKSNWPAGVCGLAAGKIVEAYHRPTVVMEQMGEMSRGSARSVKGFDFTAALTQIQDVLVSYGGHAMAAGFRAKTKDLPEIERRLSELLWQQFTPEELKPELNIDAEVEATMLNWDFYHQLQQFEPCGIGNPKPVFVMKNMEVVSYRAVGSEGKHLKLALRAEGRRRKAEGGKELQQSSNPAIQQSIDGIAFNLGYWADKLDAGTLIDVAFTLDENEWNGKKSLQLMVKDMRLSDLVSDF